VADTEPVASGGEQDLGSGVVGLLTALCRELTRAPATAACLVSRVIGDVLVIVAAHTSDGRDLPLGHGYLISDYPQTQAMLESRTPLALSLADPGIDAGEAEILREFGYDELLMVPLEAAGETWALVEVYRADSPPFGADEVEEVVRVAGRFGRLLDELLAPPRR
jgi:GAF domain-containing protein